MAYLDTYTNLLTSATAAHLLRRATFGPTRQEIIDFTGKTAQQAVELLISNAALGVSVAPPVEMDETRSDAGQPFLNKPFDHSRSGVYNNYIQYWWLGLMTEQKGRPSVLEKLTAFWQNHFVTAHTIVEDYRFVDRYIRFLRANALGNFKDLAIGITKDPAMLVFQNGFQNTKELPNENYGRELQELFTVGQKDFAGNNNYTEEDVKAAARVLTGWQVTNRNNIGSTSFGSTFNPVRHDISDKSFSEKYNNTVITGRSGESAGDGELLDLVNMLLAHPETPKFICRKLYRWYVNPNVTQEIEDQVIIPLATFFASPANNYAIMPVVKKLLSSNIFFDTRNIGAIVKSPAELVIGTIRFFDQPVPDLTTEFVPFRVMMNYIYFSLRLLEQNFLDQPSVFGFVPYYQTGYSKNWINGTTLGLRGVRTDALSNPGPVIKPDYVLGIDILKELRTIQPNFEDVAGTSAITCEQVLQRFTANLFAIELSQAQQDFLIDQIMMKGSSPRATWQHEWNAYRSTPQDETKQNVIFWRCRALLKYILRMAEFQLF
ncbi:DUF1800 domain-containing protein [Dyadobacter tibetensis]|uniref:DUF1800 domain-containing protein n=1 Tax=Dyadobacter tibetensis TaxID=1211851 RepID=UPI00046F9172|nr:DUF1800 family protein [Dyadobacter tibetensis]